MKLLTQNLSIKKLTLIIFIVMYIIFFTLTTINIYSYSNYEFDKTEKLICNYNSSLSIQIEQKLNSVVDVSKYPLIIPDINTFHNILLKNNYNDINDYNYIFYLCEMMLIQNDSINGAYIYNLNGDGVFTTRNNIHHDLKNSINENWFTDFLNTSNTNEIITNFNSSSIFSCTYSQSEKLIGVLRKIINVNTQEVTGVILLTISPDDILSITKKDLPFSNQSLSLFDSNGRFLKSTDANFYTTFNPLFKKSTSTPEVEYIYDDDDNSIVCYNTIGDSTLNLVNYIPIADAYHIDSLYLVSFINVLIFSLILFIIIYAFFLKRIFNPINFLIENMRKNIETNLPCKISYNKNDEIGMLIDTYNAMKLRIINLININYKAKLEQKDLEFKQLQNQINPHFIYNTLESIHMMAEINDDLETSIMAEYFGSIIRYSMNRSLDIVTLREEMEIIDNYIYLQKIRFDSVFTIENLINDDFMDCRIIKMIIQPLIENSIYHGLSECSGNGKIVIQSSKIDDNLILNISDNGIGMDEDTLSSLNDYIDGKNEDFKGIALRNVNRRLKLNYGDEYGLKVYSIKDVGTSLCLTLPYSIN